MREFGFDHLDVVKADHPRNRSRHVAASDGSIIITIVERRLNQVSEFGHLQDLASMNRLLITQLIEGRIRPIGVASSHRSKKLCIAIQLAWSIIPLSAIYSSQMR